MKTEATNESVVREALKAVLDPELGVSIVDLGLVYKVAIDEGTVKITMTLTTIGCPLFQTIENDVKQTVGALPGVDKVETELTFDPPWDPSCLSESAKVNLGLE